MSLLCHFFGHKWLCVKQTILYVSDDEKYTSPKQSDKCKYTALGPKLFVCTRCEKRKFEENRQLTNSIMTQTAVAWVAAGVVPKGKKPLYVPGDSNVNEINQDSIYF